MAESDGQTLGQSAVVSAPRRRSSAALLKVFVVPDVCGAAVAPVGGAAPSERRSGSVFKVFQLTSDQPGIFSAASFVLPLPLALAQRPSLTTPVRKLALVPRSGYLDRKCLLK